MKTIRKLIFYIFLGVILWFYFTSKTEQTTTLPKPETPTTQTPNSQISKTPETFDVSAYAKGSVDQIYVDKSARFMELYAQGELVKRYEIALGFAPIGAKTTEGDGKTPEGQYTIDWRNPKSQFYRSLHISYPNAKQVKLAKTEGRKPGGAIMIHGQINNSQWTGDKKIKDDWTNGCISVSNNEMDEIWRLVRDGAVIKIVE